MEKVKIHFLVGEKNELGVFECLYEIWLKVRNISIIVQI